MTRRWRPWSRTPDHTVTYGCRRCTCLRCTHPPTPESETTMTTPEHLPRVIDTADVQVGDLIEVTYADNPDYAMRDRVTRVQPDRIGMDNSGIGIDWPAHWGTRTIHLLDRPAPPVAPLPTEWGTGIRITGSPDPEFVGQEAILIDPGHPTTRWVTRRTQTYRWAHVTQITAWEPITDGLRRRVEALADTFERDAGGRYTNRFVASEIRHVLGDAS